MSLALAIASSVASSPGFSPIIGSGTNVLWLANGVGMSTAGWLDSSGQGNTMTSVVAPTLITNQINGRSVLHGVQASNTRMATAGGLAGGNLAHTIFVVARINAFPAVFQGMVGYGGSNIGYGSSLIGADNTGKAWFGGSNNVTPVGAAANTSFHVWGKTFDGATIKGFIDGVQVATLGSVTMALSTTMQLFAYSSTAGACSCDIAEVVVYSAAISAGDFTTVNEGLGKKFGLSEP